MSNRLVDVALALGIHIKFSTTQTHSTHAQWIIILMLFILLTFDVTKWLKSSANLLTIFFSSHSYVIDVRYTLHPMADMCW